jgi:thiamine-monophosphate kinase
MKPAYLGYYPVRRIRKEDGHEWMEADEANSPTMGDLGEKSFVRNILGRLHADSRLITGHGQDASAVGVDESVRGLAFKIDRAATPVAFTHGWADSAVWGRMAVTANCSDLLASGAVPLAFMIAITVPRDWPASEVEKIVLAAQEECRRRGIVFAGGDTKEGPAPQVVGSAIGTYSHDLRPLARNTARPGDSLIITGEVGGFLGAFLQLKYRRDAGPAERQAWIDYLAHPVASWDEARYVRDRLPARAGVDTSDGVFDALTELTRAGVGIEVDLDRIPFHPFARECAETLELPLRNLLFGAGDWNILYAMDGQTAALHDDSQRVVRIGTFTKDSGVLAREAGKPYEMTGPRNEHFRSRLEDGDPFVDYVIRSDWFKPIALTK